jgi:hypothetical protein
LNKLVSKIFATAAVASVCLLPSLAHGATISFSDGAAGSPAIGPFLTNWGLGNGEVHPSEALSLPQFNPALGTLLSIDLSLSADANTTFTVTDLSGNPNEVTGTSSAKVTAYAPGTLPTYSTAGLVLVNPVNSIDEPLGPNATITFSASASATQDALVPLANFGAFEGAGTVYVPISGKGASSAIDQNGNITVTTQTAADAYGTITYEYNPAATPEPGSVALFLGSLVASTATLRRRARRA